MKNILKIIGIVFLVIIGLIVLLFIKAIFTPVVPKNYTESVETGGDIEAKYLKMGKNNVSYFEEKIEEIFKKYEVYYPSDLEKENKKYPVVIFVNGTGVVGSKYKVLFEHLASWGFIVIGNEAEESWNGDASEKCLEYLISQNENRDSKLYQKIDFDNVGITGHSQGGAGVFTSITEHEHSNMYKTAVALSPTHEEQAAALSWKYDLTKINIPIMMIAGTQGDFETKIVIPLEKMEEMYNKITSSKVMMRKTGYEHGNMLYVADGYVTAWFMWQLQNDDEASKAFTGESPEIMNNKLYQDQKIDIK